MRGCDGGGTNLAAFAAGVTPDFARSVAGEE